MHVPPKSPGQRRCERENTDLSKNKSCLPTLTSLSFSFLLACTTLLLECMAPAFVSGKNAFFKQRVFSLAASWQMACKFLSNTLSLSIPWIFGEINYHWVVTKMGRQKPNPEFFVFVKQAIYIPHICPHMKSFVSVWLCSPLPPFLYYCKRNRSFLRTFLTVKTILTFDIFAVVELFMLSLLPSLLHEVASYCHRTSLTSFLFLHISFQVTVFDLFFVFLSDQFVLPVFMFDFE